MQEIRRATYIILITKPQTIRDIVEAMKDRIGNRKPWLNTYPDRPAPVPVRGAWPLKPTA